MPIRNKLNEGSAELFTRMTGEWGTQQVWESFSLASTSALGWLVPPQGVFWLRVVEDSGVHHPTWRSGKNSLSHHSSQPDFSLASCGQILLLPWVSISLSIR